MTEPKISEKIVAGVMGVIMVPVAVLFFGAWTFGGFIGAVWAAVNDDLLNVVLSIFIPFYGAYYTIIQLLE